MNLTEDTFVWDIRLGFSFALFVFAIGTVISHQTGSLFPWLAVSMVISASTLLLIGVHGTNIQPNPGLVLIGITIIGILFRSVIVLFPASMIGMDPDKIALLVQKMIVSSSLDPLSGIGFYQHAGSAFVLPTIIGYITGTNALMAVIFSAFATSVILILVSYLVGFYLFSSRSGILAAILTTLATATLHFAFWPINQNFSIALWAIFLVTLIINVRTFSLRTQSLPIAFLGVLTVSHKLSILIVLLLLFIHVVITLPFHKESEGKIKYSFVLLVISAILLILQWNYMTDFIINPVNKILSLFTDKLHPTGISATAKAANRPYPGLVGILWRRIHGFILLPVAGISWIYVFSQRNEYSSSRLILSGAAAGVVLTALGVIGGSAITFPPLRALLSIEFILMALVSVIVLRAKTAKNNILVYISLLILVTSQLAAGPALPDNPSMGRDYLSSQEIAAKNFGNEYIENSIATDYYAANEYTPHAIQTGTTSQNQYYSYSNMLINGSIDNDAKYILYRSIEIIQTSHGNWQLVWEPESRLNLIRSSIYTSGNTTIFWNE